MTKLSDYGYTDHGSAGSHDTAFRPARVTAVHKERYEIICEQGPCYARLKPGVYYHNGTEPFPTTGDFVLLQYNPGGDGSIVATLPRRTFFSRRNPTLGRGEQAVAANFDTVFIMQSLNHDFNAKRLERYITIAWQSGARPLCVLTKADLVNDAQAYIAAAEAIALGVEVIPVSAKTGLGLEALASYLTPGQTAVLLGSSGVGKSSLVNALAGQMQMTVNDIREDDSRGRHTTTHRQLIMLPCGAMIIDTPGMRELGMWDVDSGLDNAFSDIEELIARCRFTDCRHETEPDCAVLNALQSGELTDERWQSYTRLKKEARYAAKRQADMQLKQQKNRDLSKYAKSLKKQERSAERA